MEKYDGEYDNDKRHGKGELIYLNKEKEIVYYEKGIKQGPK